MDTRNFRIFFTFDQYMCPETKAFAVATLDPETHVRRMHYLQFVGENSLSQFPSIICRKKWFQSILDSY